MEKEWTYHQRVAVIGFFGGLIWSLIGYALFSLNFSKVGPAMAMLPWALPDWKETYLGHLAGILFISLLSIGVAFLYRFILQRIDSIWPGIGYGLILWGVVFYLLHPLFPGLTPLREMDANTLTTTICLFILYGVFIGYSISYEYHVLTETEA